MYGTNNANSLPYKHDDPCTCTCTCSIVVQLQCSICGGVIAMGEVTSKGKNYTIANAHICGALSGVSSRSHYSNQVFGENAPSSLLENL